MHRIYSALILDDDPDACEFMRWFLEDHFSFVRVVTSTDGQPIRGFDLYLLDNNFKGDARAVRLVKELRSTEKNAFIAAFSGFLEPNIFKSLLNAGCDGAFEKGNPADLAVLGRMMKAYIDQREVMAKRAERRGFKGAMLAMIELIDRWNTGLEASKSNVEVCS